MRFLDGLVTQRHITQDRGVCGQEEQSGLDSLIINSLSSDLSAHHRTLSLGLIDPSPCECGKPNDGE